MPNADALLEVLSVNRAFIKMNEQVEELKVDEGFRAIAK